MGIYDEIEELADSVPVNDYDNITDDVCEVCFMEDWYHTDDCPLNENNRFFDEEVIYSEDLME